MTKSFDLYVMYHDMCLIKMLPICTGKVYIEIDSTSSDSDNSTSSDSYNPSTLLDGADGLLWEVKVLNISKIDQVSW